MFLLNEWYMHVEIKIQTIKSKSLPTELSSLEITTFDHSAFNSSGYLHNSKLFDS